MHLAEIEIDEKLWEIWVSKETGVSFDEFKRKSIKRKQSSSTAQANKEVEERNLANAKRILNMHRKDGD